MIARPCITCGEVIATGTHCAECRPARNDPRRSHVAAHNGPRWKNLSKRLRRRSPFCEICGDVERLQLDHVIPASVCEELTYVEANLRVLCTSCNGRRQNRYTHDEAQQVLARLHADYRRHPTRAGRERIAATETALATRGEGVDGPKDRRDGKACSQLHTGGYLASRA